MRPKSKKKTLTPKQKKQPNFSLGLAGEKLAGEFLVKNAYQILASNYEFAGCEIDIIARDLSQNEIVFVEVKTRASSDYGSPSLAVNQQKIDKIARVASHYLKSKNLQADYRFDIIAICGQEVEHFINVTWP